MSYKVEENIYIFSQHANFNTIQIHYVRRYSTIDYLDGAEMLNSLNYGL